MATGTLPSTPSVDARRGRPLDDWYRAINRIYLFQNLERDSAFLFMHLVEVCGSFRAHRPDAPAPEDVADGVTALELEEVVPKALAWWLALCAKVGVRSVEEMVWAKFPAACPYCHRCPHDERICKPRQTGPEWEQLGITEAANRERRPRTIDAFADLLAEIYQPASSLQHAIARLAEELGELGESVRVFDVAPHFFLSEAPDVFAWLIQCHRLVVDDDEAFGRDLDRRVADAYPDVCAVCNHDVCRCPPVLSKHHGRLAAGGPSVATAYRPRGGFLASAEMVELVRTGAATVDVAGKAVWVDTNELAEIRADLSFIRGWLVEHGARSEELEKLIATADGIAMSELIEETRLIELREALDELLDIVPTTARGAMSEFVVGVASNLVSALLLSRSYLPPSP